MADSYISNNYDELFVPAKAATLYAAFESSMFLSGAMMPIVNAPNGVLKTPKLANDVTASSISAGTITGDVAVTNPTPSEVIITADLIAARSVIRDLGGIDANEIGRILGRAVSKEFDTRVMTALDGATASTNDSFPMTLDAIFDAVQQIRETGETGMLRGIVSPAAATEILKLLGTAAYAGGEGLQGQAIRGGFLGMLGGVQFFTSSYVTAANTSGYIFAEDAGRIALQKNVDLEIARRAEAVGVDAVASLHAGVGLVDATRAVKLINVV